jgi:uncharacterized protein YrrD
MFTLKGLRNKWLVSLTDGKKLGEIQNLYLDSEVNRMAAVFLGKEGFLSRRSLIILQHNIQVFGSDVWLISGPDNVIRLEEAPESDSFQLASDLLGREIQTDGGTRIGVVDDILMGDDGAVQGFALGKVYVQGPLAERKTIARGAITNLGNRDNPMIASLPKAEGMDPAAPVAGSPG